MCDLSLSHPVYNSPTSSHTVDHLWQPFFKKTRAHVSEMNFYLLVAQVVDRYTPMNSFFPDFNVCERCKEIVVSMEKIVTFSPIHNLLLVKTHKHEKFNFYRMLIASYIQGLCVYIIWRMWKIKSTRTVNTINIHLYTVTLIIKINEPSFKTKQNFLCKFRFFLMI